MRSLPKWHPSWLGKLPRTDAPPLLRRSGRYPIHVGLQHGVITDSVPEAIPLSQKLWPEYMREVGSLPPLLHTRDAH